MSEIHIGPHTRDKARETPGPHDTTGTFDREINLKAIFKMVGGLVVIGLVVHVLVLWTIRGFERLDEKKDVRPSPIEAAIPQGPPPGPQLQTDDEKDMRDLREEEEEVLDHPAWVDPAQGRVRVPIDVAMEVIASRGLGPDVVGGRPGAAPTTPEQMRQSGAQTSPGAPGATVQMSRPVVPAPAPAPPAPHPPGPPLPSPPQPPGEGGKGQSQNNQSSKSVSPLPVEGGAMGEGPGVRGPASQEIPL